VTNPIPAPPGISPDDWARISPAGQAEILDPDSEVNAYSKAVFGELRRMCGAPVPEGVDPVKWAQLSPAAQAELLADPDEVEKIRFTGPDSHIHWIMRTADGELYHSDAFTDDYSPWCDAIEAKRSLGVASIWVEEVINDDCGLHSGRAARDEFRLRIINGRYPDSAGTTAMVDLSGMVVIFPDL